MRMASIPCDVIQGRELGGIKAEGADMDSIRGKARDELVAY